MSWTQLSTVKKVVEQHELTISMTTPVSRCKNKKQLRAVLESTREPESIRFEQSRLVILDADHKTADMKT